MGDKDAAFVGEIPANHETYLGPLIFDEYARDLAGRVNVGAGGCVLETAAGTGLATRKIRDSLRPDARMIVTDLNADMLKLAEPKFGEAENIEFRTANAQELPFGDDEFDAVVCQFSVMFFTDKLAALRETARVLKPGRRFLFNIWDSLDRNGFVKAVHEELAATFPDDPPKFFDTPYGYYRIDEVKNVLEKAGFGEVEISVLPKPCTAKAARDVALGYVLGTPVRLQISEKVSGDLTEVVARVEQAVATKFGSSPAVSEMQAIVFSALLPG